MRALVAFGSGLLFATGLCIAGMTSPGRVIGFLDLQRWDPSLLFTLLGAFPLSWLGWRLRARLRGPLGGGAFAGLPPATIDRRLLLGAALFGVGWGLAGFCPGPVLVAFGGGARQAFVLLPAMLGGMGLYRLMEERVKR